MKEKTLQVRMTAMTVVPAPIFYTTASVFVLMQ